ncbi:MAG: MaoC family dehydratase N-terminal domain-containing protein [Gammaproteobacteria bacterium]|jgi:3-methylfumaryl-CoA hydratase
MTDQQNEFAGWIGTTRQEQDCVTRAPLTSMAALLDKDPSAAGLPGCLPPLWHWLYFHAPARQSRLAPDGHPAKGEFLPPITLPRRMWAGGRLTFLQDIPVGCEVTRTSTIDNISQKQGRSGRLAFVLVRHAINVDGKPAVLEHHDIVYRDAPVSNAEPTAVNEAPLAPQDWDFSRQHCADIVLLFRYSALTFNAHRIHYDRDYAVGKEGYPGLVVHGPLLATLLMELLTDNKAPIRLQEFSFRALRPVFDNQPFRACGKLLEDGQCQLWIANQDNHLCMEAMAHFHTGG